MLPILIFIVSIPVKFEATKAPSALKFVKGGALVDVQFGKQTIDILSEQTRSISWNLYPVTKQQVLNIWQAIGYSSDESIFLWSYGGDVTSLSAVCDVSSSNLPTSIYLANSELVSYAEKLCSGRNLNFIPISSTLIEQ